MLDDVEAGLLVIAKDTPVGVEHRYGGLLLLGDLHFELMEQVLPTTADPLQLLGSGTPWAESSGVKEKAPAFLNVLDGSLGELLAGQWQTVSQGAAFDDPGVELGFQRGQVHG
jgi:hypothetical protein